MGLQNELCLLSFFVTVTGVLGGDYCFDLDAGTTRWCNYGCCGYSDRECCDANVALIVGMTVLSILIVATIIAVVCCFVRRRATTGRVIQTNTGPGLVVATAQTTMMSTGQHPPYVTPGQQPPQPYAPQPYAPQPYAPQPYAPQPYNAQPYAPQPYNAQPYPMGQQAPPPGQPVGGAMSPPPYSESQGGQVNPGFDYKPMN